MKRWRRVSCEVVLFGSLRAALRVKEVKIVSELMKAVAIIVSGLLVLPIVAALYYIPSIRLAFDQLAYEDAMRG